ncbi:protein jagged-2 [Plakobranchus ocellatus]|uniref:Protein jagged-2 n=1 Tax=Plakobranchus ocellatus TaxID=259542 RepID=A0AAV4BBP4_9GAST|nr:protein jagged-2 [Plakobranchus ocellatus]
MWFIRGMMRISWAKEKVKRIASESDKLERSLIKTLRQLQLLGHICRRKGLEHLAISGKIEGKRSRGRRRITCIENLKSWAIGEGNNNNFIRLTENRFEWRNMIASVCSRQGVTIAMTPPAMPGVSLGLVSMSTISANTVPNSARRTSSQTSFSLDFTVSSDTDVDEYYLEICSTNTECDDIFRKTLISNRQSGRLTIQNGSIVFMNGNSQSATSTAGESITTSLHTGGVGRRKRSASGIDVTTPNGMSAGQSIVMTTLTTSDMTTSYNSAAASGFTSYITDPSVTTASSTYLERILYNRVSYNSGTDTSFSLTSVGDLEMPGPLTINYPYDPSDLSSTWQILHWNPTSELWQLSHETCDDLGISNTYSEDSGSGTITIKVCNTRGNSTYNSTYEYFREETQFLLTDVSDTIPNTAPTLTSSVTNSMDEDGGTLVYQLVSTDAEGDTVTYSLDTSAVFTQMSATVDISTSGLFLFTPDADEHGDHRSVIKIAEDPIAGITALTSTYTLTITVNEINDAPVAFAFLNGVDLLAADPTEPVEVLLEEKRSGTTDATSYTFIFGAYDQDGGSETLSIVESTGLNGTLTDVANSSSTPTCSSTGIPCSTTMVLPHAPGQLKWIYVTYTYVPTTDWWGIDPAQLYVEDANGSLSSVITMNFSVMARPCQNDGTCTVPVNATYTCNNMNRALSFDYFYTCTCASGYEGTHCEIDVDECASTPCVWPYECVDGANSYTCKCPDSNPDCDGIEGWMIGIFVVCGILLLVVLLLLWYFFALRRGRLMWRNLCNKNRYRRDSLDSGRDSPAKAKGDKFNFENKGYIAEKEDEDGFNSLIDRMMSPPPGQETPPPPPPPQPPAANPSDNPFTLFGAGAVSGAAISAAAPSSTIMAPQSSITPRGQATTAEPQPQRTPSPDSEPTSPTRPSGMYLPRNTSSTSLRKTSMSRKGSTSSWLNSLLNSSDTDTETPRAARPITPVEHPAVEEEDDDDADDHLFFA